MDYSPIVLKNKGIPCQLAKVKKIDGVEDWERELTEDGEPLVEQVNIRFTNNIIAEIEMHWGSLEAWQEKLESMPVSALRQTLAFCLKRHPVEIGEAMLDGEILTYSNIVGTAWAISNGVDPTVASTMLKQSNALAVEQRKILNTAMQEQQKKTEAFLGSSGSRPGPKRAARSKSSGS